MSRSPSGASRLGRGPSARRSLVVLLLQYDDLGTLQPADVLQVVDVAEDEVEVPALTAVPQVRGALAAGAGGGRRVGPSVHDPDRPRICRPVSQPHQVGRDPGAADLVLLPELPATARTDDGDPVVPACEMRGDR